ncbi:HLA class II histocompatibility antigen, DP alpha 1 chain-like isoform X2 [Brachyhypopomus gauderio]
MAGLDGEEMYHTDFTQRRGVKTLPDFTGPMSFPEDYEQSVRLIEACKNILTTCIKAYNHPEEELDPPGSSIYPEDDVQLGVRNTLICHVTGFFPPPVRVSWTRNNEKVTEGVSVSQYYPNRDGTFNMFSTLSFTPQEGDIYTCTVSHRGLQQAQTRILEVDVSLPSVGPSVFCGVGLAAGLLGVATGTFFLIKGNGSNRERYV